MAKKTKPAVGHALNINAQAYTITAVDAAKNRVDYAESPAPKGRQPSKGVAALSDLVWIGEAWGLEGREHAKRDTGGVKRVMGPPPAAKSK